MPFSNGNPNFWPKSCSLTVIWAKYENLNFGFWRKSNYMLKSDIVRIFLYWETKFRCEGIFGCWAVLRAMMGLPCGGCFSILLQLTIVTHTHTHRIAMAEAGNGLVRYPQKPAASALRQQRYYAPT